MRSANLEDLQGAVVLVESSVDHHQPPTGRRGFIEVLHPPGQAPRIQLAIDFPQMFGSPAHRRTISLNEAETARLLASERDGSFEFVLDGPLGPGASE